MTDFVLQQVVPTMGAGICICMYATPLKAIFKAENTKQLGDINPIPFSVTVANCVAWLTYGLLKLDPFVTTPNATGVVMAMYCVLVSYGLADEKARATLRQIMCFHAVLFPVLGVATAFFCDDYQSKLSIWGLAGNAITMIYYGAPLSTMAEVIKTKNSASIMISLTFANLANAVLWTLYGMAINDIYVWLPNGIGTALSVAQLLLASMFPARRTTNGHAHDLEGDLPGAQHPLLKDPTE